MDIEDVLQSLAHLSLASELERVLSDRALRVCAAIAIVRLVRGLPASSLSIGRDLLRESSHALLCGELCGAQLALVVARVVLDRRPVARRGQSVSRTSGWSERLP